MTRTHQHIMWPSPRSLSKKLNKSSGEFSADRVLVSCSHSQPLVKSSTTFSCLRSSSSEGSRKSSHDYKINKLSIPATPLREIEGNGGSKKQWQRNSCAVTRMQLLEQINMAPKFRVNGGSFARRKNKLGLQSSTSAYTTGFHKIMELIPKSLRSWRSQSKYIYKKTPQHHSA